MKRLLAILISATLGFGLANAQPGFDVFQTISKYLVQGNSEALSAWFAPDVDVTVISGGGNASRSQAEQIVRRFFRVYTPQSFSLIHTAGRANMKYALGNLTAGGETFTVTIFLSCKDEKVEIQQLKIERI